MTWLKGFWCDVQSVAYDFERKLGTLRMAPYHCCNMSSCISFFSRIDPAVKRIETFSGGVPDTIYARSRDSRSGYLMSGRRWESFDVKKRE